MGSSGRSLAVAALIAWVLTASIGLYMLRTWIAHGGLRRARATQKGAGEPGGVPPAVVFGHASAAVTGLVSWLGFVSTGRDVLAWAGVTLIAAAIALGIGTVTVWTPFPVVVPPGEPGGSGPGRSAGEGLPPGAGGSPGGGGAGVLRAGTEPPAEDASFAVTDEMIAGLLAEPFPARQRPRLKLVPLIPVAHGFAALAAFMLAVLAALSGRLGIFSDQ